MIFLILFLALALRLINLNQSLWLDEAVQAVTAQRSLSYIFEEIRGDFHPPLYHFLMHYWVRIFGSTEIALRIPSVLFGVATVYVVYLIAKEISLANSFTSAVRRQRLCRRREESLRATIRGVSLACFAALFLAAAPFHIYYSQEARMYSMATFFVAGSVYFFLIINELDINKLTYLGYFLFTLLALYSDYYAFLVVLTQIIYLIFKKKYRFLLLSTLFLMLAYLPWIPMFITQIKTGMLATQNLPGWGRLVNLNFLKALPLTFVKFSIGRITIFNKGLYGLVMLGVFGVFGGVGGYGFLKVLKSIKPARQALPGEAGGSIKSVKSESFKEGESEKENYLIILTWFVFPILAAWLISLFIPNYQPFRLLLVLPAFYLLLAYGLVKIKNSAVMILLSIVILFINLASLSVYYLNPYFWREDWRGVANLVKKEKTSIVISAEAFNWPLVYYGVKDKVINVAFGAVVVQLLDKPRLLKKLVDNNLLFYTPYLADLYDPNKFTLEWLDEVGFVKIKEISFNQIPVWEYRLTD